MATIPYGCISEPMRILRNMISYSAAFQLWVEEADGDIPASGSARAAFCLDYIKIADLDIQDGFVSPSVVIDVPEQVGFESIAQGGSGAVFDTGSGALDCEFYRTVPTALRSSLEDAYLDFAGVDTDGVQTGIGAILTNLQYLDHTVEQFEQFSIRLVDGPAFFKEQRKAAHGIIMAAKLQVRWGVNA